MKIVGVTGRIGSGKTSLCRILAAQHGVPIIDADALGHEALRDPAIRGRVVGRFGAGILDAGAEIDRDRLGAIVFNDPAALRDLESIVHPWIVEKIVSKVDRLRARGGADIVLIDAALLLSWKDRLPVDRIVWVQISEEAAVERLRLRGIPQDEATRRLSRQIPDEEFRKLADVVVANGGCLDDLRRSAEGLWETLRGLSR